jgi:hypothetical protein
MEDRQRCYKRGMPTASGGCGLEKPAGKGVCAFSYTTINRGAILMVKNPV